MEAAAVEQRLEALAHGEPAGVVLALDLLGAAHLAGQRLAPPELVDVALPTHASAPPGSHPGEVSMNVDERRGQGWPPPHSLPAVALAPLAEAVLDQ